MMGKTAILRVAFSVGSTAVGPQAVTRIAITAIIKKYRSLSIFQILLILWLAPFLDWQGWILS
jgi:hypothetical protein